jgi:hypothetical protein
MNARHWNSEFPKILINAHCKRFGGANEAARSRAFGRANGVPQQI